MTRSKTPNPVAAEALSLYNREIVPCFKTATDRAEALGMSETAIRKWERGELLFVKKRSSERALLVSETCQLLRPRFGKTEDIGAYLLHGVYEVDGRMRPIDLVVETREPDAAVLLLDAARSATVDVVKKTLPAGLFTNKAWAGVLAPVSEDERALEDDLLERGKSGVTLAL